MAIRRTLLLLVAAFSIAAILAQGQPVPQSTANGLLPGYEVISVKRDKAAEIAQSWTASPQPDGYTARGITLMYLLMDAYDIKPSYRILGAPSWWDDTRFDIQAKVGDSDLPAFQKLTYPQRSAMLQQVLTERFKIKARRETRIQPMYSLVVVKQGLLIEAPPPTDGNPIGMGWRPGRRDRAGQMVATDLTTGWLAGQLSGVLSRVVVDNTGLTATYRADLHYTPDRPASKGQTDSGTSVSIFTALEEQLGLKLAPTKGPVECLIIDHVELPTEN